MSLNWGGGEGKGGKAVETAGVFIKPSQLFFVKIIMEQGVAQELDLDSGVALASQTLNALWMLASWNVP